MFIYLQKKSIEVASLAPSKLANQSVGKYPLGKTFNSASENGEPVKKIAKMFKPAKSLDDSTEGVEQVDEIDDDGDD